MDWVQEDALVTICDGDKDKYRFGFDGKEKINEWAGIGNYIDFGARGLDSRIGRWLTVDPLAKKYPSLSPYVYAANSPISLIDPDGKSVNDPKTYKVQKGDNLTKISKRVGVSVKDLVKMNKLKDPDKLAIGQVLKVNPEVDFTDHPHGNYSNPNKSNGKIISIDNMFATGAQFLYGIGSENEIVASGRALDALRSWDKVQTLTTQGAVALWKDGKLTPGETFVGSYKSPNIVKWTREWLDGKEKFWTPQHVVGSFNLTMRVNADGYSVTVCVYDAKTISSLSDNHTGSDANIKNTSKKGREPFSTQYIRFIWDVFIPHP